MIPRSLQLVLAAFVAVLFGLSALARRFPDIAWLEPFRRIFPPLSQAQRARMRRRANIHAGVEMVLMGLALPLLYLASTVMFFHAITRLGLVLTGAGSLLLIALGFTAVWRNRHPPQREPRPLLGLALETGGPNATTAARTRDTGRTIRID